MQIQFDPFSFVVAVIAVILSGRAYYLTKKSPHLERARQNRDVVRAALLTADKAFSDVRQELDAGRDIGEVPSSIEAAFETIEEYGPRLPEHHQLWVLGRTFFDLRLAWKSIANSEGRLLPAEGEVILWETEMVRPNLTDEGRDSIRRNLTAARTHRSEIQRTLDTARLKLGESIEMARTRSKEYVRSVDADERNRPK